MKNFILFSFLALTVFSRCSQPAEKTKVHKEKQRSEATTHNEKENALVLTSKITCPKCGYATEEPLPTEVCQITYTCKKCKATLHPKAGDCCVFCTYGDHKCPSKQ